MKKMIVLALLMIVLAIVLAYPGSVSALVNADSVNTTLPAVDNQNASISYNAPFWSLLSLPVLITIGVIIVVIIVLVLLLLLAPSRKKKGNVADITTKNKKSGKQQQKIASTKTKEVPAFAPSSSPSAYEEYNPTEMPSQSAPQPVQPRPLQPQPSVKPLIVTQAQGPQAAQPQPSTVQPQVQQPFQQQVQSGPAIKPQPVKPQPMPVQPQPAAAPRAEPTPAPQRFAQSQQFKPAGTNKPIFHVTNLNIMPNQVKEGESVTISITVFNGGVVTGKYSAVFKIDNVVESIAELQLGPGATQTTVCTVTKEEAGDYFVEVDSLQGTFAVLRRSPAAFDISNIKIKPERVKQGQPVTVAFTVTNTGEKPGTYNASLLIKGMTEASEDVYLEPGETKSVTFEVVKETAGFYPVSLEEHTGRFVVEMDWTE